MFGLDGLLFVESFQVDGHDAVDQFGKVFRVEPFDRIGHGWGKNEGRDDSGACIAQHGESLGWNLPVFGGLLAD